MDCGRGAPQAGVRGGCGSRSEPRHSGDKFAVVGCAAHSHPFITHSHSKAEGADPAIVGGEGRDGLGLDVEAVDEIVFGAEEDGVAGGIEAAGGQRAVVLVLEDFVGFGGVDGLH